ncbi:MAG: HPr family phosphocarrier protein [Spirochaetales bacterium]|nr:HPr family phosphocarrier protein [Spirochaetales bacterium]
MTTRNVKIQNRAGIHARPASMIVQTAQGFDSSIWMEKEDVKINAKSIMNILTLGATYGTELVLSADGTDETEAVEALASLFDNKFKEE